MASCSGEISSPPNLSFDGTASPRTQNPGLTGGSSGAVVSDDHPAGVGDPSTPNGVGWSTRFPKLSNAQWENTTQTLLALTAPSGLSSSFTQEPADNSYDTQAAANLTIDGDAWARYQNAAETLAQQIIGNASQLAAITPTGTFSDANAKGTAFVAAFGRRAYRRPLTTDEQATYLTLFKAGASLVGGDAYAAGVRVVLEAMLQSPHFLYRVESSDTVVGATIPLDGDEIASRLSFALWNSMPSDELMAASSAGELDTKDGVAKWAGKLLADPKAQPQLLSFHEQTFQVSQYGTQDKDPSLNVDTAALAPMLQDEAHQFFDYVINQQGGGIAEVLTEPTAFVNATTAPYYGVTGITGSTMQKTELDPEQRIGLLSQLGFLTKNATSTGSDPVHRGLIVVRKVLCDEPDPPPAVFSLPMAEAGLTTRQTYEKATACGVGCHDILINPPGFSFEGFDTMGKVRTTDANQPIDATGTLTIRQGYTSDEKKANPSSTITFENSVDMLTQLAGLPRTHECYARNWMQYVLARDLDPAEKGAWESLRDVSSSKASVNAILTSLVQLDTFRTRVPE